MLHTQRPNCARCRLAAGFLPWLWLALTAALVLVSPRPALAWGADGHRVVAALAQERLSPVARRAVAGLLAQERGESLVSLSTWADEHRSPATVAWHYLNFAAGDCRYDPDRQCLGGRCIVAAIDTQRERLRSGDAEAQFKALRYLIHLVADLHQPLHAGLAEDRGGNLHQLRWGTRGSNLHALWDSGLIEARDGGAAALWQQLRGRTGPTAERRAAAAEAISTAGWAEASCRIVQTPGFYPEDRRPGAAYAERMDARLLDQLDRAAWHLAGVLNADLDGPP